MEKLSEFRGLPSWMQLRCFHIAPALNVTNKSRAKFATVNEKKASIFTAVEEGQFKFCLLKKYLLY